MIRVLKGADFSANNIGRIELPKIYSKEALNIFAKFSALSDSAKDKISDFVDSLVFGGVYDKLLYMMMPMYATTPSEGVQNVILETQALPTCNGTITDGGYLCAERERLDLTEYMLRPFSNGGDNYSLYIKVSDAATYSASERFLSLTNDGTNKPGVFKSGDTVVVNEDVSKPAIAIQIPISINESTVTYIKANGGTIDASKTSDNKVTGVSIGSTISKSSSNYNASPSIPFYLCIVGDGLTGDELVVLNNAVNQLLA